MLLPRDDGDHPLARSLRHLIHDPVFPCVGAKSALSRDQIKVVDARDITSGWDDLRIYLSPLRGGAPTALSTPL